MTTKLTVEEVVARVQEISSIKDDNETAHVKEDELYRSVLKAIAEGRCKNPKDVCVEALKTAEIEFARWCA